MIRLGYSFGEHFCGLLDTAADKSDGQCSRYDNSTSRPELQKKQVSTIYGVSSRANLPSAKGCQRAKPPLTESAPARGVRLLHLGDRLCGRVLNRTWPSGLRLCKDLVYPLENFG